MAKFQAMFLLILISVLVDLSIAEVPKPSYARTVLKVSRSLPGETEELKVRTSEGNLATLIVKRRDKSYGDSKIDQSLPGPRESQNTNGERKNEDIPAGTHEETSRNGSSEIRRREEITKSEVAQIEQLRAKLSDSEVQKRSEKSENVTEDERAAVTTKDRAISERNIDYGNWTPLGKDGRALKLEELTTEEYQNWKPVQTDLKTTTEERTNYARFGDSSFANSGLLLLRNFQDRAQRNLQLNEQEDEKNVRYTFLPHQIRSSRTNVGANLSKNRDAKNVPPEVIVRSEINVKSSPKRTAMSLDRDGTPVIHGKRVPDEPMDKLQTWRNSRVINNKLVHDASSTGSLESTTNFYPTENLIERQRFERFFKNVNRRYGRDFDEEGRNVFFEWDPKNYKSETLKADVYEPSDNYRASIHKRMLHPDGIATYPNSQLYTPESQKIAPVALKPGARAPVLQYAHPELGVQSAKIVKNEKRRPDNFPENQHSFTEQRQKKKYVLNDKNIVDSYNTKNYYPNQHFYGLKRPNDAPFWVKISENLKNQFSNSVEKVSQFTRPVIDPLVEATHKISQNLGLSKGKEAQDKIGTVTSGTSILIPALGLVASGAALGIGAVAVGRYLDVDVLKRSKEGNNEFELERQRALEPSASFMKKLEEENGPVAGLRGNDPAGTLYLMENSDEYGNQRNDDRARSLENGDRVLVILEGDRSPDNIGNIEPSMVQTTQQMGAGGRRKRDLDYLDVFKAESSLRNLVRNKRLQRKGADSISEIVEIDLPVREGNIDVTEFLIPRKKSGKESDRKDMEKDDAILIVEDGSASLKNLREDVGTEVSDPNTLENVARIVTDVIGEETKNSLDGRSERRRRSIESSQELDDAFQNLENVEIAEVAHIDADWTNTPCAKRVFCDAMIQRGQDAVILMEKKMAALLGIIQPGAAVQVSSHFEEVMDAVRKHDCSSFLCPHARPSNVFL